MYMLRPVMDTVARLKSRIQLRGFSVFRQSPSLQMTTVEGGSKTVDGRLRRPVASVKRALKCVVHQSALPSVHGCHRPTDS